MGQTLEQLYQHIRERLRTLSVSPEQAQAEADRILQAVLNLSPTDVYMNGHKIIGNTQVEAIDDLLRQRIDKRIPIQYLLHEAWFYGLQLYVNPHVLIPRPETELLVEKALDLVNVQTKEAVVPGQTPASSTIKSLDNPDYASVRLRILDIGTGSGAIPLALAHKLGDRAEIVATDISEHALKVARINQRKLQTNVDFRQGDLFEPLAAGERFNIIISNPPYVDPAYRASLDVEVAFYEPEVALFPPGTDPYLYYRHIAEQAPQYLQPGGHLLLETGAGMTGEIETILRTAGFQQVATSLDLGGVDRIVSAVRA